MEYSMSALAAMGLKTLGRQNDSVRGPLFWHTADGESIYNMWVRARLDS